MQDLENKPNMKERVKAHLLAVKARIAAMKDWVKAKVKALLTRTKTS